jgi:hypothetical protein
MTLFFTKQISKESKPGPKPIKLLGKGGKRGNHNSGKEEAESHPSENLSISVLSEDEPRR